MVILDTSAIIEAFKETPTFSKKTREKMNASSIILSISFAEIACKIKLNKLEMSVSPQALYRELQQIENLQIIDIGVTEWLDSIELSWNDNKDPADRIIVSYAMKQQAAIVTTDKKIKQFYKNVIW